MHQADVPATMSGRQRRRCSGVPNCSRVGPDLAVGEPRRGERRAGADQRLEHDEPLERGAAAAALVHRPGHAEPAPLGQLEGELARVPMIHESSRTPYGGDRLAAPRRPRPRSASSSGGQSKSMAGW